MGFEDAHGDIQKWLRKIDKLNNVLLRSKIRRKLQAVRMRDAIKLVLENEHLSPDARAVLQDSITYEPYSRADKLMKEYPLALEPLNKDKDE
jgi:hypothetical protein